MDDTPPLSMAAEKKRSINYHSKFAKAETLLILALISDALVTQWLFGHPQLTPAVKTLIKMCLVVGMLGPVFNSLSYLIDTGLDATRSTGSKLFFGRMGIHLVLMGGIFLAYYYNMHHARPWKKNATIAASPADIDEPNTKPFWRR